LTTAKQCLSDGFQVTVFEAREEIGGQWNYEIPDPVTGNAHSSVYQGVISNSCRDTSCFSDFPIDPSRYPDFYGHKLCLRYVEEYADHFGLKPHIRFNTRVTSSEQLDDGRWQISFTGQDGGGGAQSTFDALFVCTGRNTTPHIPDFEGVKQFQGQVMHSHVYRQPEPFSGKRVAIIGFGSSAVDISSEICGLAAECHLITRRGGWVIPRFVLGKPAEAWDSEWPFTQRWLSRL
jgi:dimethylaniline monooxygenase (N-oxide forming) / hypotaurine monooxygenase